MSKKNDLTIVNSIATSLLAFMLTWVMVRPPMKIRYLYPLPQKPYWLLLIASIVLILIDLIVLGPGITMN